MSIAQSISSDRPARGPIILSAQDLRVSYVRDDEVVEAVRGVTFDIAEGEVVALVGESGSGKTTVGSSLIRLLPAHARLEARTITFGGHDLSRLSERQMRRMRGSSVGLVPQDPTVSLDPIRTIGSQIVETLKAHGRERGREREVALDWLRRVQIDDPERRMKQYAHEISGGMRQRILIAIALLLEPQLIVADEPTSGLDATVQKQVLDQLSQLVRQTRTAVLLVTHDLGVASDRADRIIVMQKGEIVEQGDVRQMLDDPIHPYTKKLLASVPSLSGRLERSGAQATTELPHGAEPILLAENVTKTFGRFTAVDNVALKLGRGETLGIVGESGSGKSTTARMIAGLTTPTSGTISYRFATTAAKGRSVQYVYQNPYHSLNPYYTVKQILTEPWLANKLGTRQEGFAKASELLDAVALDAHHLRRRPTELSGGQLQRVAIARALMLSPEIVVLDEPVSALDVSVQATILDLLAKLQRIYGLSYIFISHDLAVVKMMSDDIIVMRSGKIVEKGPSEEIFAAPKHDYTRMLIAAIPGAHGVHEAAN